VVETGPLEKDLKDHKWYAADVGQVKDGKLVPVEYAAVE
jgi:hypothetical protein